MKFGAAVTLSMLATGCITGGHTIGPDYPTLYSPATAPSPVLTMSWPEPRRYSEDWDLGLDWKAHRKACPDDGDDFSVRSFERSAGQVTVTFRCDDGTFVSVEVALLPQR